MGTVGGHSRSDHEAQLLKQRNRHKAVVESDQGRKCPQSLMYIWEWFMDLHRSRGSNGFGVNPLSWTEIKSWSDLMRKDLEVWEVQVIKNIDGLFLTQWHEDNKKKDKSKK